MCGYGRLTRPMLKKGAKSMDLLSSNSELLLEKSLGFLWTKQAAVLDNIANAETPNYRAKVVTFEESVRQKLEQAGRGPQPRQTVRKTIEKSQFGVFEAPEVTRTDDNGVNITDQMVELIRNAYQSQYVMQCISSNLTLVNTAVRGQ